MEAIDTKPACLVPDRWLSEVIGRAAFRLEADPAWVAGASSGVEEEGIILKKTAFIYSKTPVQDVLAPGALASRGFRLVDTALTFEKDVDGARARSSSSDVRAAREEDAAAVVALAGRSFHASRFHRDPHFPGHLADRIKARWVENYFDGGRGDRMGVAVLGGRVVGFVSILYRPEGVQTIDLIAVDAEARRRGVGRALVAFAEADAAGRGARALRVGTQAGNTASVRLYEDCGFRFASAAYVFHNQTDWADDDNR